jgi:hypothetical protein
MTLGDGSVDCLNQLRLALKVFFGQVSLASVRQGKEVVWITWWFAPNRRPRRLDDSSYWFGVRQEVSCRQ